MKLSPPLVTASLALASTACLGTVACSVDLVLADPGEGGGAPTSTGGSTSNASTSDASTSDASTSDASSGSGGASSSSSSGSGAGGGLGGAPPLGWPDSRTGFCSNGAAEVDCFGGLSDHLATQDGALAFPSSTYFEGAATTRDSLTGLVWMKDVFEDVDPDDASFTCESLSLAELSWRLPSARELASLWDAGRPGDAIDTEVFDVGSSPSYWAASLGTPVVVDFDATILRLDGNPASRHAVRCVSGTLTSDWVAEAGTFTDGLTRLTWSTEKDGFASSWEAALLICDGLGNGYRLPSVKEMASVVTHDQREVLPDFFLTNRDYWTSTPVAGSPGAMYFLDADVATIASGPSGAFKYPVCVRDADPR